jgi:hypothetical protein
VVCKLRYTDGEVAGWFGNNTAWWFGSNAASPAAGNNAFHNLPRNAIKTKKIAIRLVVVQLEMVEGTYEFFNLALLFYETCLTGRADRWRLGLVIRNSRSFTRFALRVITAYGQMRSHRPYGLWIVVLSVVIMVDRLYRSPPVHVVLSGIFLQLGGSLFFK